jgi:hypothetical protein
MQRLDLRRALGGMRNWCDNRLPIRGDRSTVIPRVELLDGNTPFDFNRVISMPDNVRDGKPYDAGLPDTFPGWYQWCRENWGVKRNAMSVTRRGYGCTGSRSVLFTVHQMAQPRTTSLAAP